ncbi:MAG: hypothetical protein A3F84_26820 [Candidatus Handelsmanbacteria bacterium RIFCSPLOWO2_12_FULL_64_10]|uniref:Dipeptidylpeptidase IV N-terminal domain-containing protein n=1 Tax=Handelsmanbacteria sp. (strain RIFCSPLOWO2_12_FULL_64_10) TaxID=1817868 RepID=A0A1F6CAZ5_HANXR|nr:MAG: hypothetical protein A3F84_26820 [Candidatus Handelsmanbacteria bacterium RIFCSPLOWO2_12_FULL_64_10]
MNSFNRPRHPIISLYGREGLAVRRVETVLLIFLISGLAISGWRQENAPAAEPHYTVAFFSNAPLNTDIFIADSNGSNPRPIVAHPDLDYNASFSRDGRWIIFTSHRAGSADIYRVHPDGSGLERLTDDPAFDDQAALSPDGTLLAFVSTRSGQADIWVLELATGALSNLTDHPAGDFRPAWSPDGAWIAFSSDRDSTKPKFSFTTMHSTEIYAMRRDGADLRRLTHLESFAGSPCWSPDGGRIAFYEGRLYREVKNPDNSVGLRPLPPFAVRSTAGISTIDVRTGERRAIASGQGGRWSPRWLSPERLGYVRGDSTGGIAFSDGASEAWGEFVCPDWSPDGRWMVFHREVDTLDPWPPVRARHSRDPRFKLVRTGVLPSYSPSGDRLACNSERLGRLHNSILIMNSDGSSRSVFFRDQKKNALGPVWSPAGDRIAFGLGTYFGDGSQVAHLAVINSDGTGLKMLTEGERNDGFPSWAPDGSRLVFRSGRSRARGLAIIDVETGQITPLTSGSHNDNFPVWSPLGDLIAFTSDRDGDYEIYTIRPDGADLKRLTRQPGNDAHCAWSPDGKWIAFSSARGGFKDEAPLSLPQWNPQPYGEVCVIRADGSDVRALTDDQYEDGAPTFVPTPGLRLKDDY